MDTKTSSNRTNFAEKIIDGLQKAQQEIEELTLQFALGKAEASDKFEEIKKEFSEKSNEWKRVFSHLKSVTEEKTIALRTKMEELQLQLALGKAEAKEAFEEQRKKIMNLIQEIEVEIKNNPELTIRLNEFKIDLEKFKLKMEVLKLKFELKKFEMKDDFKSEMADTKHKIEKIFGKVEDKWDDAKKKYSSFGDEIDLTYKHLKNAIKSL